MIYIERERRLELWVLTHDEPDDIANEGADDRFITDARMAEPCCTGFPPGFWK